jgi:hypothetical protein
LIVLPAPVTTFSFMMGAACWAAQVGSFAMSIGRILGGVPVKVIVPEIAPAAAWPVGSAAVTPAPRAATARSESRLMRIGQLFLVV